MLISKVFKFGNIFKKNKSSRCSDSSSEDAEKSPSDQKLPGAISNIKALESSPIHYKNAKPERRKSQPRFFRGKHTSMPTRLEIVRVGADAPSKSSDSPSSPTKLLWRDQFGAEELAGLLLTPREIERQEIINELVATEHDYVSDLSLINDLYMKPLSNSKFVTLSNVNDIFLNLPALLSLHQFFFKALQKRVCEQNPIVKDISDVMLEWIKELSIYTDYLVPQRRALSEYERLMGTNKQFASFIRNQSALPESRGLDLMSYLIKPFQRLLKYPLLLKNLLEVSSSGTVDYINAVRCHHALESLITRIQEVKFRQEQAPTLDAWQSMIPDAARLRLADPRRKLKSEGNLTLVHTEIPVLPSVTYPVSQHWRRNSKATTSLSRETVHFALFGDILIHVPEQYRKGLTKFQLLSSPHPTTTLCKVTDVRNIPDSLVNGQTNWFVIETIDTNSTKLVVEAESAEHKERWMEALRLAIPSHTGS